MLSKSNWTIRRFASERVKPQASGIYAALDTTADVDREIGIAFTGSTLDRIQTIISLEPQLANVELTYEPQMAFAGSPLSGDQSIALAQALKTVYENPLQQISGVQSAVAFRTQGIDPAGLSSLDRQVIQQLTGTLAPEQIAVLQENLAAITRRYASRK